MKEWFVRLVARTRLLSLAGRFCVIFVPVFRLLVWHCGIHQQLVVSNNIALTYQQQLATVQQRKPALSNCWLFCKYLRYVTSASPHVRTHQLLDWIISSQAWLTFVKQLVIFAALTSLLHHWNALIVVFQQAALSGRSKTWCKMIISDSSVT